MATHGGAAIVVCYDDGELLGLPPSYQGFIQDFELGGGGGTGW